MSAVLMSTGPMTHCYELVKRVPVEPETFASVPHMPAKVAVTNGLEGVALTVSAPTYDEAGGIDSTACLAPERAREIAWALLDHADASELAQQQAAGRNIQAFLDDLASPTPDDTDADDLIVRSVN